MKLYEHRHICADPDTRKQYPPNSPDPQLKHIINRNTEITLQSYEHTKTLIARIGSVQSMGMKNSAKHVLPNSDGGFDNHRHAEAVDSRLCEVLGYKCKIITFSLVCEGLFVNIFLVLSDCSCPESFAPFSIPDDITVSFSPLRARVRKPEPQYSLPRFYLHLGIEGKDEFYTRGNSHELSDNRPHRPRREGF